MEIKFRRLLEPYEELVKYDIFVDGANSYYAESKQFTLIYTSCLYMNNSDDTITRRLTVTRILSFLPHYHIKLMNGILTFKTVSFLRGHFQCVHGPDVFDIYYYRKNKCIVCKNNTQVARIELPSLGSGIVQADRDSDYELIMAFVIIMDKCTTMTLSARGRNVVTPTLIYRNMGISNPYLQEFNPNWQPK